MKNFKIERLVDKDPVLCNKLKQWCYELNGCCQEVHKDMGPFLNEYMYQDALEIVLEENHLLANTTFRLSSMVRRLTINTLLTSM